jgi:uncharacterized protein
VQFNVSALLLEPVGTARSFSFDGERADVPEEQYKTTISGDISMMRTERGILVHADLDSQPEIACGRCAIPFTADYTFSFDEEFVAPADPVTGEPAADIGPDDLQIGEDLHLDVSEAVRQYEQAGLPIRPVCRPDCAGLCATCGRDLNDGPCDCPSEEADDRWSSLATLAEELKTEEASGSTEA